MRVSNRDVIYKDIDILTRKLVDLKSAMKFEDVSKGQEQFLFIYLGIISEYINKGLDIMDSDKYQQELIDLED